MDVLGSVQQVVDNYSKSRDKVVILEAGCGSLSRINIPDNAHVVGIDISQQQLDRNDKINEKILADIQTFKLDTETFDIIICWDVLEHLDNPTKALENFLNACKTNGRIVLAFPNLYSLKGILTKLTPYKAHIWFYRYVLGNKHAGKEDAGPFPTPFRRTVAHTAIRKLASSHNSSVELFALYEGGIIFFLRTWYPIFNYMFDGVSFVSRILSFRTLDAMHSDCIMVLKKG